jgi:hypothetical protein
MITFPSVLSHPAAEVYPDSRDINLYYLVANRPALRLEGGTPVFRGLFWTGDLSATDTVAGLAGAQLNFDVELLVDATAREEIRAELAASGVQAQRQAVVLREEQERLSRMARATGTSPGRPEVPEVGPIRFGSIQYLGSSVVLLEKAGDGFVAASSSGGPASQLGTNNAAFMMRLGPTGAAVWYRGLEQDATAVGVRYELEFEVILPSLEIHVWAGSFERLDIERKVQRVVESVDQGCVDVDVERIDVTEVSERLRQEGLVNIEIVKGSAQISDEVVASLRDTALGLVSERVKQILMSRIRGMTEEERRTGLQQKVIEELSSFAELRLRQSDVVRWKVAPQGTMTDFLGGIPEPDRAKLVTLVDLSDPVVRTLELPVTVGADWDGDPAVTAVEVTVTYPGAQFEDDRVQQVRLDRAHPERVLRWRRHRGDAATVRYAARAYVAGTADPVPVGEGSANGPVHVEVPALGRFGFRVRPYGEDFALKGSGRVEAVQLDYAYGSDGAHDHTTGTVVLRGADAEPGRAVAHRIDRAIAGPVVIRPTYLLADGGSIEGAETRAWVRAGEEARVDLPSAWPDRLRVGARVRPGVPGLTRVRVELEHVEADRDFESTASLLLDADVDWEGTTTLAQADRDEARFRYRYAVAGEDQYAESPWLDAEGDGDLPVLPVLAVRVRPGRLGLGSRYTDAVLRLRFTDEDRDWETTHELFLTEPDAEPVWLVPRASQRLDRYWYSLVLTAADGHVDEVSDAEGRGENLVLRPPV